MFDALCEVGFVRASGVWHDSLDLQRGATLQGPIVEAHVPVEVEVTNDDLVRGCVGVGVRSVRHDGIRFEGSRRRAITGHRHAPDEQCENDPVQSRAPHRGQDTSGPRRLGYTEEWREAVWDLPRRCKRLKDERQKRASVARGRRTDDGFGTYADVHRC